jgi:hypothetical protein
VLRRSPEAGKVDADIDYGSTNVNVSSVARRAPRDGAQRAAAAAQGIDRNARAKSTALPLTDIMCFSIGRAGE